ncbi:MAG TPA: anti-sigma factor [Acidimicrobiales bacterium]|nr:anti-sigma factor [Acidimicrobiales bacterium]
MSDAFDHHPLDEVAVYATGGLDDPERSVVEAHIARCAICRAELDAHRDTLSRLTADEAPPPALWDRIASTLPARPEVVAAHPNVARLAGTGRPSGAAPAARSAPPPAPGDGEGEGPDARVAPLPARQRGSPAHLARGAARRARQGRVRQVLAGLAAAAAVALVAVGVTLAVTDDDDDGGGGEIAAPVVQDVGDLADAALADPEALAVLASGDGQQRARLVRDETGSFVVFDALPPLAAGRAYQLWTLDGAAPVSLGVLGDGTGEAVAVALPANTTKVAISDAPAGGEVLPTGPIVASGDVAPA